jgi:hypothetical protein
MNGHIDPKTGSGPPVGLELTADRVDAAGLVDVQPAEIVTGLVA